MKYELIFAGRLIWDKNLDMVIRVTVLLEKDILVSDAALWARDRKKRA
ncbi:glycosyltransferase family 4 protein [Methanolobus halotolerans]|nr:glycosyltransferase family 4 protein [Methanolobus halotolerans]